MARKADKLRPYRVDYFDIPEMKGDRALVRSTIVRNVTAQGARDQVLYGIEAPPVLASGRVIIRAYRYYKNAPAKETFKAVEDLFTVNKAVEVMEVVEKFRAVLVAPVAAPVPVCPYGYTKEDEDNGRMTAHNCAVHTNNSPCGTAEIHDNNYTDPDKPSGILDLPTRPIDLDAAAPVIHPAPTAVEIPNYTFPDHAVIPTQPAVFDYPTDLMPGTPDFRNPPPANEPFPGPMPLWLKLALFCGVAATTVILVLAILHGGH